MRVYRDAATLQSECCPARLYATAKLSARDLCVLCHWADVAGAEGGAFSLYAKPPDLQSGKYQFHLDSVFPEPAYLVDLPTPMHPNRKPVRKVRNVPVRMACESICDEFQCSDSCCRKLVEAKPGDRPETVMDTDAYRSHWDITNY